MSASQSKGNGIAALALAVFIIAGCARQPEVASPVVARVGDRTLTEGQLLAWEASLGGQSLSGETRSAYIRRWVEDEMLYQAAVEKGLLQDVWVAEKRDELLRRLLTARMMEMEFKQIPQPAAGELAEYYREHSAEFVWAQLHLVVEYWRSETVAGMEALRSNLGRGREDWIWTGAAGELETGRLVLEGSGSASPDLWKICAALRVGQVTPVTRLNDAFWIFKLVERHETGTVQELEEAGGEITQRLMEAARDKRKNTLIRRLTDQFSQQGRLMINLPPVPPPAPADTLKSAPVANEPALGAQ